MEQRPLSVTAVSVLYIATGVMGFVYHATGHPFGAELVWVQALRLAAIVVGAYMFRGHDWARWSALGWMAYHVVLAAFHDATQFAIHVLFLAIIAYALFRPAAASYFRRGQGRRTR